MQKPNYQQKKSSIAYKNNLMRKIFNSSQFSVPKGSLVILPYKGSSMLPTIPYSCEIIVSEVLNFIPGDIYVFIDRDPDSCVKLVCHRLIKVKKKMCLFKGDNRTIYDPLVPIFNIKGKYEAWTNERTSN